jgi:hypothetical protein
MSDPDLSLAADEFRGFSIPLPRPLWIGIATVALVGPAVGLHFGAHIFLEHLSVREIQRVGGGVETRPRAPQWLLDYFGKHWPKPLDEVIGVRLIDSGATDATLADLRRLTSAQFIWLDNARVTDAGLPDLKGMTELRQLSLINTHVTDEGLQNLKGLVRLRSLWLDGTHVTDAGLQYLKAVPSLECVWLRKTRVTEAGVAELNRALPRLIVAR